jgi:glycosyltransferase involved in cell wall biosynthesis
LQKTVCAFGFFDLIGERSWVIRKGLEEAGFFVSFCRTEVQGFLPKIRDLKRKWQEMEASADVLYVVFPGHFLMPLAWWLARRRRIPIVFDAFLSLYDTEVRDRRRISIWNPKAWLFWFFDWFACALADIVLIDTEEQKEYFARQYHVSPQKILVIPVGSRPDLFTPVSSPRPDRPWTVRFYGSFIPLHGIETILHAAKELEGEGVMFEILGKGQTLPKMRALAEELALKNVHFLDPIPLDELPNYIRGADVCLGIFGQSAKAKRVIPTKVYEILACGKPLITARTPAIERVFRDREHLLCSEPGNPHDLAEKIRELKNEPALAGAIAASGHALSLEKFQPRRAVSALTEQLAQGMEGTR